MAEFIYSPCTPADVGAMANVYMRAFGSNPMNKLMFPPERCTDSIFREWLTERFSHTFAKQREMRFFKVTEASTGKVVAISRWAFPFTLSAEEKKERALEKETELRSEYKGFCEGANVDAALEFFGALQAMQDKYVDHGDMYVVHLLATDPDYQRRGLGTMALAPTLAQADAEGRRCYIEATAAGRPLYLKLGWRDVDKFVMDMNRWGQTEPTVNWILVRDPMVMTSR